MKQLIATLSKDIPQIRHSMIAAAGNVQPRHLLDEGLKKIPEAS
jgi:tRNA 2-thiocytidine biosynthesis protein TtcA